MQALRYSDAIEAPRCLWQHVTRVPDIAIPETLKAIGMVLGAHRKIRAQPNIEYIVRWISPNQERIKRIVRLVRNLLDQRRMHFFHLFPESRQCGGILSI